MNDAKLFAVEDNKKLFQNRDNDEGANWTIEAKDGEAFKIHPYIFKPRSDYFKTVMTSDFKEKESRRIAFKDFTSEAMLVFIKFMYGYELNEMSKKLDLNKLKELLLIGDMCLVQAFKGAVNKCIAKLLTKDNIFEMLEFFLKHQPDNLNCCIFFIGAHYSLSQMKEEKILEKYPVIAVGILDHVREIHNIDDGTTKNHFMNKFRNFYS